MTAKPLQGYRVLDLTHARSGPACVRVFADWGADVIRIEPPLTLGAKSNVIGSPDGSDNQNLHRNKRSLTLNLKTAEGLRIFKELVKQSDVVVENMRADVKHRLGIDFETLHRINPRLVYGSISGFGQDGPYADRPGVDQIAQGIGGLMSVTGEPGRGPQRTGVAISDLAAGAFLAQGLLVALLERERTGIGRWVKTSLIESMIALLDFQATRWLVDGELPAQEGNNHPTGVPSGLFKTKDGAVNIAAGGQGLLSRLGTALDRPDWQQDPRFAALDVRRKHRAELLADIESETRKHSTADLVERINRAGVPCGPVLDIAQMFGDPQVQHVAMTSKVNHPRLGELELVTQPYTISGHGRSLDQASPDTGGSTQEILQMIGLDLAEIERLRAEKVI